MDQHHPLAERWRQEAHRDERRGLKDAAALGRHFADELETYERERGLEGLTLREAAAESGYSADHLALLVAKGAIENAGEKRSPRIRRQDLPRKPKKPAPKLASGDPDLLAIVKAAQST